jgi:O-antigen/teichoic acid export membrane protein
MALPSVTTQRQHANDGVLIAAVLKARRPGAHSSGASGTAVTREVSAGILDAALSSLATFVIGFFAARSLSAVDLGAYALVFAAFMLVTRVPAQLIFKPAEVIVGSVPLLDRLGLLRHTLRIGALPALLAALSLTLWALLAPAALSPEVVVALSITGVASAFFSPIQDHVRHMLHLAHASWWAAAVSAVQVGVAVAGVWVCTHMELPAAWIPFGVLALANVSSMSIGLCVATPAPSGAQVLPPELRFRKMLDLGAWLLPVALIPSAAGLLGSTIVSHLAGPETLGYAEAARILGQPPFVASMGLAAVLGPKSLRAAQMRQLKTARQISRQYVILVWAAGLPYLALVGFEWGWNPLYRLLPNAYHASGLVAATILGSILMGMDWPSRSELVGAGRVAALARLEAVANAARVATTATARYTGVFALPASLVVLAAVRSLGYRAALRSVWGDHQSAGEDATRDPAVTLLVEERVT